MKNWKINTIVVICLCLVGTSPSDAATYDFRNTTWGMSKEDVMASEKAEFLQEGLSVLKHPYVGYTTDMKIGETVHKLFIVYYFVKDQLNFAKYSIVTKHSNKNDYLTDFDDFQTVISKKYGPPLTEETIWTDDIFQDNSDMWGIAVSVGALEKYATWETDTTTIMLRLKGDNQKISFQIRYETKDEHLLLLEKDQVNKQEQAAF